MQSARGASAGIAVTYASVLSGEEATRYARSGAGAPVLIVCDGDPLTGALLQELPSSFLTLAPELAAPPDPFSSWIRGFLDGLGVERASLVAGGAFALPALSFALLEPGRVERLVLVLPGVADPEAGPGFGGDLLSHGSQSLLVVRAYRGADADEVLTRAREIANFIAAG